MMAPAASRGMNNCNVTLLELIVPIAQVLWQLQALAAELLPCLVASIKCD